MAEIGAVSFHVAGGIAMENCSAPLLGATGDIDGLPNAGVIFQAIQY